MLSRLIFCHGPKIALYDFSVKFILFMASNKFDEYLVQVEHDFEGLRREAKTVVSSNFLRLENGGAFHHGDVVVDELMHLVRNKS